MEELRQPVEYLRHRLTLFYRQANTQMRIHMTQQYRAAVAAAAAGVTVPRISHLLQRGIIHLTVADTAGNGSGNKNLYARTLIIQTAIIEKLNRIGVGLSTAAKAAAEFTKPPSHTRRPCEIKPLTTCWLVGLAAGEAHLVDVPPDRTIADALRNKQAAWLVNLSNIVRDVDQRLETEG